MTTEARKRVGPTLLSLALLLACAGGGYLSYHFFARPRPVLYPAAPGRVPSASSDGAAPPMARVVPERLPQITLPDLAGVPKSLESWSGQDLVINFWAPWCAPCRREIPLLSDLSRERRSSGVEFVGIALDQAEAVQKYVEQHPMGYPVLIGAQGGFDAARAFGMDTVLPFTVFSDRSGRIVTVKIGELSRVEANLILDRVHDVDDGRVSLAAAQQQILAARKPAQSQQ
ncbi:MAG: TlpA family protein disulfide reductase [Proteobacteria bacterium]|nr:TlpA family protein disulfide reductase [Pseudomonadota bacterium]